MIKIAEHTINELVKKFETPSFIDDDPVQFPHRYELKEDKEVSALIASSFAYGKRKNIVENLEYLHSKFEGSPYKFVINFDIKKDYKIFSGFKYRYNTERDINYLLTMISNTLKEHSSLENAFMQGYKKNDKNIKQSMINFVDLLRNHIPCSNNECLRTVHHLLPSPKQGSACKRLNLFLKWMVRPGPVDLQLWNKIDKNKLIIPLDVHVSRVGREWGLTDRKADDWKTAEEMTEKLKTFDSKDPVKYDFAIFGAGITNSFQSGKVL